MTNFISFQTLGALTVLPLLMINLSVSPLINKTNMIGFLKNPINCPMGLFTQIDGTQCIKEFQEVTFL